ncbi:uncharacterized protein LOC113684741 [Pocillopora damicornis]|nr:uncharacterized protein LOC113684741 [Pocillopora damicornis]
MTAFSALQTWKCYFFSTFVAVGILSLFYIFRLEVADSYIFKQLFRKRNVPDNETSSYIMINETNAEIANHIFTNAYRPTTPASVEEERSIGVQNVEITRPGFISCKGNATREAYGDSDCSDNSRRDNLCHLLRAWTIAAKEHNIIYTLAAGSLIGMLRNNDLIPWDTDIDIFLHVKYFPLLQKWEKEKMFTSLEESIYLATQPGPVNNVPEEKRTRHNCNGKVTSSYSDMCSFLEPMARLIRGNCFIDFFHYEEKDDMVVEHKENLAVSMHKYTDFYPFRPCVFMGFSVSCPNKPLEVLRVTYNSKSDMRKPPKVCKNGNWVSNK